MRRVVLFCLWSCIGACGASASSTSGGQVLGERLALPLEHASALGQRAHVVSETTHREETVTSFHGQVIDTEGATSAFRFDGIVEVLAIDEHGMATELRYDVRSFTHEEGALSTDVLRPGQVLTLALAETRDASRAQVDAAPVSEELMRMLGEVVSLTRSERDRPALYGSMPRAVGERWQADVREIATALEARSPLRFDASHLRGEAEVVERGEVDGIDGLALGVVITADRLMVEGLASGASVREGRMDLRLDDFLPFDAALPVLRESMDLRAELALQMATPQGPAEVSLTMTMASRRTVDPL